MNIIGPDDPTIQKSQIGSAPRGAFFLETPHGPSSAANPDAPAAAQRTVPQCVCQLPMKDRVEHIHVHEGAQAIVVVHQKRRR
jgi:hypothetical protein